VFQSVNNQDYRPPSLDDIPDIVAKLRKSYNSDITKSYEWRILQLQRLRDMINENRDVNLIQISLNFKEIIRAVQTDLGKRNPQEVISSEITIPLVELDHTIKHLYDWLRPGNSRLFYVYLPDVQRELTQISHRYQEVPGSIKTRKALC
jgi:hypothetical protein